VVSHPEIDFVDERHATGRWCLQDYVIDTSFDMIIRGAAFYDDEYRKGDDGGESPRPATSAPTKRCCRASRSRG